LEDAAIYEMGRLPQVLLFLLDTPQMRRLGPWMVRNIRDRGKAFAESAWHNPEAITPEVWRGYLKPLQAENWDIGLWELVRTNQPPPSEAEIMRLQIPTLVLSGQGDRIVPVESSLRLAETLPDSQLALFSNCGHIPHEECPEDFLDAVYPFLSKQLEAH
jgi:pimeloyl-ACP methyl ester carboxylesterase